MEVPIFSEKGRETVRAAIIYHQSGSISLGFATQRILQATIRPGKTSIIFEYSGYLIA